MIVAQETDVELYNSLFTPKVLENYFHISIIYIIFQYFNTKSQFLAMFALQNSNFCKVEISAIWECIVLMDCFKLSFFMHFLIAWLWIFAKNETCSKQWTDKNVAWFWACSSIFLLLSSVDNTCALYYDVENECDYIVLNFMVIDEWWIGEYLDGSMSLANRSILPVADWKGCWNTQKSSG